jgi:hypothetical protein
MVDSQYTKGFKKGKDYERERILKLIQDHYRMTHDRLINGKHLITIIKEATSE